MRCSISLEDFDNSLNHTPFGRQKNKYGIKEKPVRRIASDLGINENMPRPGYSSPGSGNGGRVSPTVNKLRARHPPEAVVNRKREGIMGKKVVLKPFEPWWKKRTMKAVQKNGDRISAGTVKCRSRS
jgi:hypothetical protein